MKLTSALAAAGSLAALAVGSPPACPQAAPFLRGDSNLDGGFDISDGIFTLRVMFLGEPPPGCDDAADSDDDGLLSVTDAIYGMRFLFLDGSPPPAPFGQCGADPTDDPLACARHPSCEPQVPCIDQGAIDELLGQSLAFTFCLPAGTATIPGDSFSVAICPAEDAKPCGEAEQPGCPVEITSVKGSLDVAGRRLVLRFEGRVTDLPIIVTESFLNTSTTCLTDFHGQAADAPFSFELVIPLAVEEAPPGTFVVTGAGEGTVENVDLALTATGGIVCRLFQAGQGAFIALLLAPLEELAKAVSAQIGQALVGQSLCVAAGG